MSDPRHIHHTTIGGRTARPELLTGSELEMLRGVVEGATAGAGSVELVYVHREGTATTGASSVNFATGAVTEATGGGPLGTTRYPCRGVRRVMELERPGGPGGEQEGVYVWLIPSAALPIDRVRAADTLEEGTTEYEVVRADHDAVGAVWRLWTRLREAT